MNCKYATDLDIFSVNRKKTPRFLQKLKYINFNSFSFDITC